MSAEKKTVGRSQNTRSREAGEASWCGRAACAARIIFSASGVPAADQPVPMTAAAGRWCEISGFGAVLNHQTRAAAIAMGRDPQALHACLEATTRVSLHVIYKLEFSGFRNVSKPTSRRRKQTNKPTKIETTREAIRPAVEAGESINRIEWGARLGVAEQTVQSAVNREIGRLEGLQEQPPVDPADMPANMQKQYEAALRKARKELRGLPLISRCR